MALLGIAHVPKNSLLFEWFLVLFGHVLGPGTNPTKDRAESVE